MFVTSSHCFPVSSGISGFDIQVLTETMMFTNAFTILTVTTAAFALGVTQPRACLLPYFYNIGDSTVTDKAGWGEGFRKFDNGEQNRAVSGTTTASWRRNGRWNDLIESIGTRNTIYHVIVTLQFGHKD